MIPYGRAPVFYPSMACSSKVDDQLGPQDRAASECLIVEGDSAAKSVERVRCRAWQAILALQGKPINAYKANLSSLTDNDVIARLGETLVSDHVTDDPDWLGRIDHVDRCRFDKILLLMDPDADGIHCGVLLMGFFRRFAPEWIEAGRVWVIHPPMYVFHLPEPVEKTSHRSITALTPQHAEQIENVLQERGVRGFRKIKYRGLGSMDSETLRERCVDVQSRRESQLTVTDVDAALSVFGQIPG